MSVVHSTKIEGCYIIYSDIFSDHRGIFSEIYKPNLHEFISNIKQLNYSFSKMGTLRGIHRSPYGKLITCVSGSILDVCVDLRPESKTYLEYISVELDNNNLFQLYIPAYCGHGFYAKTDATIIYAQNDIYSKKYDETYCYKSFNINWPDNPILISDRDEGACNEIS